MDEYHSLIEAARRGGESRRVVVCREIAWRIWFLRQEMCCSIVSIDIRFYGQVMPKRVFAVVARSVMSAGIQTPSRA